MARAGVTYTDIAKASETIKSQGQEPTVDRVREHLGTGSKSTIAPLLKRWKSNSDASIDNEGLPSDLIAVVKSLHERVQLLADDRIKKAQTECNSITENLRQELVASQSSTAELNAHQQALEQQLQATQAQNQALKEALEKSLLAVEKYKLKRDSDALRIVDLKAAINESRQENRDIRDHFEHYQQRTAEDRQQERDQFRQTNQQAQSQVQHLSGQLNKAETQISALQQECAQHNDTIGSLGTQKLALQQQSDSKTTEIETANEKYQITSQKNQELHQQAQTLQDRLTSLESLQLSDERKVMLLTQSLEKTESELRDEKGKVGFLADENRVILQEKAVIQGQFKQLQSSI